MIQTLVQAEKYFGIKEVNSKLLQSIRKQMSDPIQIERQDLEKMQARLEFILPLVLEQASKIDRITRILNYIAWKKILIKYDLINNGEDVLIHWKNSFEMQQPQSSW